MEGRGVWYAKLSMGIDAARILVLFLIVTGHFMQMRGLYLHFSGGVAYPFAPPDFPLFTAGVAAQRSLPDKVFTALMYWYWSYNFAFFVLSGMSLWLSTLNRGSFCLRDYMQGRLYGVYLGYAAAVVTAFVVAVWALGHKPGEHDLNFLLLGVVRARETIFYNDTLWFVTVLLALYLVFPLVVLLYARLRTVGLVAVWAAAFYCFKMKMMLSAYSFLFCGLAFFLTGVVIVEVFFRLGGLLEKLSSRQLGTAAFLGGCGFAYALYGLVWADVVAGGVFQNDTHATGLYFLFLALSLGFLLPDRPGLRRALRTAGRATFAVYLFHYLVVRLYNNNAPAHDFLAGLASWAFPPFTTHIFAGAAAMYAVLLLLAVCYQWAFDRLLVRGLRKAFDQTIQVC